MPAYKLHQHRPIPCGHYRRRSCRRGALCALTLLLSVNLAPLALADSAKEEQVKVGYIYNFAKFIKWPAASRADDAALFSICTEGVQPLSGAISLLQNRQLNGRKITVLDFTSADQPGICNILFISASERDRLPAILQRVSTLPVLTISDLPDFTGMGGIIGMKVLDKRVRFDINLGAAQKAGLEIDSQLLKLATRVLP